MAPSISSVRAKFDVKRTVSATTFDGTFKNVGGPTTHIIKSILFQNNTNVTCQLSDDGITQGMEFLPTERFVWDNTANHGEVEEFSWPIGTQFEVSGLLGAGNFNITILYAQ